MLSDFWHNLFKNDIDKLPYSDGNYYNYIKEYFYESEWFKTYELIEFIADKSKGKMLSLDDLNKFYKHFNIISEEEFSAYRFDRIFE